MLTHPHPSGGRAAQRGAALITSLAIVTVLTGAATAILMVSLGVTHRTDTSVTRARALQLAECGVSEALGSVSVAVRGGNAVAPQLGTQAVPLTKGTGSYWVDVTSIGGGTYRAISTGRAGLHSRRLDAVFAARQSVFSYAIFAGNSSGDSDYAIELGGDGGQADRIVGDLYSGGSLQLTGDALVTDSVDVAGAVTGGAGNTGIFRAPPDVREENYSLTADFDVASLFAANGTPGTYSNSGTALQMPESSPAHIFRLNPDDRTTETSSTSKDDYFLEDPYEAITNFTIDGGGTGHTISLSGALGAPGPIGTDALYFIDGNLWLHNYQTRGARFASDGIDEARVTFAVRGNVYFSDDLELMDPASDGVAFIALRDPGVPDSGNIYLGDSNFGTIDHVSAFMFAENDFYDNNLTGDGSSSVSITGTMAAGNQVNIESDSIASDGTPQHTMLEVLGDDRLTTGALDLPGIPGFGIGTLGYEVVYWKELSPQ